MEELVREVQVVLRNRSDAVSGRSTAPVLIRARNLTFIDAHRGQSLGVSGAGSSSDGPANREEFPNGSGHGECRRPKLSALSRTLLNVCNLPRKGREVANRPPGFGSGDTWNWSCRLPYCKG